MPDSIFCAILNQVKELLNLVKDAGSVPERPIGRGCKPRGFMPSGVRIPPGPQDNAVVAQLVEQLHGKE